MASDISTPMTSATMSTSVSVKPGSCLVPENARGSRATQDVGRADKNRRRELDWFMHCLTVAFVAIGNESPQPSPLCVRRAPRRPLPCIRKFLTTFSADADGRADFLIIGVTRRDVKKSTPKGSFSPVFSPNCPGRLTEFFRRIRRQDKLLINSISGRKSEITINPIARPKPTIRIGSIRLTKLSVNTATSSSNVSATL